MPGNTTQAAEFLKTHLKDGKSRFSVSEDGTWLICEISGLDINTKELEARKANYRKNALPKVMSEEEILRKIFTGNEATSLIKSEEIGRLNRVENTLAELMIKAPLAKNPGTPKARATKQIEFIRNGEKGYTAVIKVRQDTLRDVRKIPDIVEKIENSKEALARPRIDDMTGMRRGTREALRPLGAQDMSSQGTDERGQFVLVTFKGKVEKDDIEVTLAQAMYGGQNSQPVTVELDDSKTSATIRFNRLPDAMARLQR